MGSKISLLATVSAHYKTLRNDRTNTLKRSDFVLFVAVPLGAGAVAGACRFHMRGVEGFLAGLAVFTALLFALVIFLFQLRLQLKADGHESSRPRLVVFIDEVFANVNYSVAVGVVTTAVGVLALWIGGDKGSPVWISAIMVALCVHLLLTIFMCIKRLTSAYEQLT